MRFASISSLTFPQSQQEKIFYTKTQNGYAILSFGITVLGTLTSIRRTRKMVKMKVRFLPFCDICAALRAAQMAI